MIDCLKSDTYLCPREISALVVEDFDSGRLRQIGSFPGVAGKTTKWLTG